MEARVQYASEFYVDSLENWVNHYSGRTLRIYDVAPNGLTLPSGVILAEFVIPDPSHNAPGYNSNASRYEATIRGTWTDQVANAGGTPRSVVIGVPGTGTAFTVKASGTAGGPTAAAAANPPLDLVLNADVLSAGAPFTITKFLQFLGLT